MLRRIPVRGGRPAGVTERGGEAEPVAVKEPRLMHRRGSPSCIVALKTWREATLEEGVLIGNR
jgi:hypothetical protein